MNLRLRIGMGVMLSVLLLMLVLSATPAVAQSTSSVRGTVADQQGSVLPNATVTLTSKDTNLVRTQKSGPSGNF